MQADHSPSSARQRGSLCSACSPGRPQQVRAWNIPDDQSARAVARVGEDVVDVIVGEVEHGEPEQQHAEALVQVGQLRDYQVQVDAPQGLVQRSRCAGGSAQIEARVSCRMLTSRRRCSRSGCAVPPSSSRGGCSSNARISGTSNCPPRIAPRHASSKIWRHPGTDRGLRSTGTNASLQARSQGAARSCRPGCPGPAGPASRRARRPPAGPRLPRAAQSTPPQRQLLGRRARARGGVEGGERRCALALDQHASGRVPGPGRRGRDGEPARHQPPQLDAGPSGPWPRPRRAGRSAAARAAPGR